MSETSEREKLQKQFDEAMIAFQNYSRVKGVRRSDIAMASTIPAMIKKRLDALDKEPT